MAQTDRKIREQKTTVNGKTYIRYVVDYGRDSDGKRVRRTFNSKNKAEADLDKQEDLAKEIGRQAKKLTDRHIRDAAEALEILNGTVSLKKSARFYFKHNSPDGKGSWSCMELFDHYVKSRENLQRAPETIRDIKNHARKFFELHKKTPASHITTTDVENWLDQQKVKASTRNKRRRILVGIFNYAIKRKCRIDNPAAPVDTANEQKRKPHILTTDEVERMLRYAEKAHPQMVPYLTLCTYAGIRPDPDSGEISRLDWSDVDLTKRVVFVSENASKTNDERFIEISDNLLAWLAPWKQEAGHIYCSRTALEDIKKKAKVRWAQDCMRHSFGSYYLKLHTVAETMDQMGHRQVGTLFKHYRRAVRKEDAESFWRVMPKAAKADETLKFPKAS
jgi:integrase